MLRLLTRTREERRNLPNLFYKRPHLYLDLNVSFTSCALCTILQTMDATFPCTLLTDIVYSHGGTTELVQVMNRLGMISSEDTHDWYYRIELLKFQHEMHISKVKNFFHMLHTQFSPPPPEKHPVCNPDMYIPVCVCVHACTRKWEEYMYKKKNKKTIFVHYFACMMCSMYMDTWFRR